MDLVAIPWQPHLFVARSYLTRLQRASKLAGHNIYLNSIKSPTGRYLAAWRALEEAIYLYDLYLHHGGAIASNPYNGKRYHLRGAGGDIRDKADRQYMIAAGFLPDPDEWWHFSDPNWANMPIIAINVQTAGHGTIPTNTGSTTAPVTDTFQENIDMILVNCTDIADRPGGRGDVTEAGSSRFVIIAPGYFAITSDRSVANAIHIAANASDPSWVLRGQKDANGNPQKATDWSSVRVSPKSELAGLLWNVAGYGLPELPNNGGPDWDQLYDGRRWSADPARAWS